jgi:hypothetical protein
MLSLKLEWVGQNQDARNSGYARMAEYVSGGRSANHFKVPTRKPWVSRITGYGRKYKFERIFIDGKLDYSEANGPGSRGVYLYFHLTNGLYEISSWDGWKSQDRYFCRVEGSSLTRMSLEEIEAWIENIY